MQDLKVDMVQDERGERRQRVLLRAIISYHDETVSIPCVVKDMSDTGARLLLDGPSLIPERFSLHVEVGGYRIDCERVWSHGLALGVHFIGPRVKSRIHRDQCLRSSQDALSHETICEMQARPPRPGAAQSDPEAGAAIRAHAPTQHPFGRR